MFATADTDYNIFGFPFLQTYCKTIDSEHSCLILKNSIHITTLLKQVPFLEISHKQPPFFSKVFNLTFEKQIHILGRQFPVIKIPLKK